jgi:hypothetical protein
MIGSGFVRVMRINQGSREGIEITKDHPAYEFSIRVMLRYLLLPLLLLAALMPIAAVAQTEAEIERFEVSLWPEYDRPSVLVILQAKLSPETIFPATVSLPIPSKVGEPHAVAVRSEADELLRVGYTRQVVGEWAVVTVETDHLEVRLEYYDSLTYEDRDRSYTFIWPGGIDLGTFFYEVQQPLGSSDLRVNPPGETSIGEDGLTYFGKDLGAQSSSSTVEIDLSYTKSTLVSMDEPPVIKNAVPLDLLEVALWPEFDRTQMLVTYRALLPSDVSLPANVGLPIPADVGDPHAVAIYGADGELLDAEYTRDVEGEWATITVATGSRGVWLEYYDALIMEGSERKYEFLWPGGLVLGTFAYEIQQPVGVSEMKITPLGVGRLEEDGFFYYRRDLGSAVAPKDFLISLTYHKSTSGLSVDSLAPSPSLVRPATTRGGTPDLGLWLPWVVGGFAVILLAVGGLYFLRFRREEADTRPHPRRRLSTEKKAHDLHEIDASPVFCHQCGLQAGVSDHFCRRCGARLRQ